MFRSALLILSGNAATSLLLLARNLLVARLIPVADYGIAATFAIAMAVVEMMSQLGLQQQIVQAKNGEDPYFQAALQGFQVLRGVIAGIILFFLAPLLANFMNIPQAAWAYQVMALVPVLNAFTHFDVHRMNRSMVFWPLILTGAVPALLSVLAIWPLTIFYGDYKVMLYAIIVQAVMTALTSHLVAKRPYRLVLDPTIMAQSLRFGWPLLINGILLFAVFNGDKLIVGRELGMETLAIFAMGFTLTLTPTLVMAKSAQNFFLPQLSAVDRSTVEGMARFQHLSVVTMQASLIYGALLVGLIALLGAPVITLLLGEKFDSLIPLLIPLAVMQAIRVAKTGGLVVALSCGHTRNAMYAGFIRITALPVAWYTVVQGADLLVIIWIAAIGEAGGYALSLFLTHRRPGIELSSVLKPTAAIMLFWIAAITQQSLFTASLGWINISLMALSVTVAILLMKDVHLYLRQQ